jgi:transposase
MKKDITVPSASTFASTTIGLDLSDRSFQFCQLNTAGDIVEEGNLRLNRGTLLRFLVSRPEGSRIALETGGHSAWVREVIEQTGHQAIVANARELKAVTGRSCRNDQLDARQLARLARLDPALLNPVQMRPTLQQADLFVIRARAILVEARTMLINFSRGATKTMGHRLPSAASHRFAERARAAVPEALQSALGPLLEVLELIKTQVDAYDEKIETMASEQYPETRWLRQVPGIGSLTALTFVLTIGTPERFSPSRDVGAFLGMVPRRKQSGMQDPHLRISKCGDRYLRKLLVQCAHVLMGRYGPDCALRRWALEHAQGSRVKKKRTVVAVARKLAVLLHRLWRDQQEFRPFPKAA